MKSLAAWEISNDCFLVFLIQMANYKSIRFFSRARECSFSCLPYLLIFSSVELWVIPFRLPWGQLLIWILHFACPFIFFRNISISSFYYPLPVLDSNVQVCLIKHQELIFSWHNLDIILFFCITIESTFHFFKLAWGCESSVQ